MPKYFSYLRTGSGSDEIEVQIDGASVEIRILRHWMLSGLKRYQLACRDHPLSASFGLFVVERIDAAEGEDRPLEPLTLDEEEMLLPLVIEYLKVSESPVYVHDHSQLVMMRPLGYATWNDSFELVLMVHDFEVRAEKGPLADVCNAIDKKKFAGWSEATAAKQAAREGADAELSLEIWSHFWGGKTGGGPAIEEEQQR